MVGAGRDRSEAPSSARAGRGVIIPPQHLRRALDDSMQTPVGASSSAGRGRGKPKRASRGGRGGGRGRKAAAPSLPPPPADSPDHRSAPSQEDWSRTPVHERRVDELSSQETPVPEPSSQETRAPESSSHKTPVPESSPHVTPDTSGHADDEETWSEDSFSEDELVEQGKRVYQRGGTKLPAVPATRDQRWLIQPNRENGWIHPNGVRMPNQVLGVICRQHFLGWVTLPGEG
nr:uncharacterized protein LOC109733088 [Aegilops tauschii subsp. strangulata]